MDARRRNVLTKRICLLIRPSTAAMRRKHTGCVLHRTRSTGNAPVRAPLSLVLYLELALAVPEVQLASDAAHRLTSKLIEDP